VPSDEPLATVASVAVDRAAGKSLVVPADPQLFLEGGTRIFPVKDPASLKGLGPGDKVRFEVERKRSQLRRHARREQQTESLGARHSSGASSFGDCILPAISGSLHALEGRQNRRAIAGLTFAITQDHSRMTVTSGSAAIAHRRLAT